MRISHLLILIVLLTACAQRSVPVPNALPIADLFSLLNASVETSKLVGIDSE